MTLYNLRTTELGYRITKFTTDLDMESSYEMVSMPDGTFNCGCPAGHRQVCRHRQMIHDLVERVDTPWFYCFKDGDWSDPTGQARAEQEQREANAEGADSQPHGAMVAQGTLKPKVAGSSPAVAANLPEIPPEGYPPIKRRL